MKSRGRDVHLSTAGLLVDPNQSWIGATPDAIMYDAAEQLPWGCVDLKGSYTLRKADHETLLASHVSVVFEEVIGRMGVTNPKWADHVLYGDIVIITS